ncbi:phytanoyl-CoA dioxygenase family protein [Cellvibrio sp. NN19]|uniref:phytanoyl-CoA dioxygenase family protein n=1 Tax=Cellvibrio chitinivorans TaxID=3102792 RepID=UPI002B40AFA2|nr:phytanoyl-CoA dioxygenase family protein [Cellvibrio sp. NN19]
MFNFKNIFKKKKTALEPPLTTEELLFWKKNGYLILKKFFPHEALKNYSDDLDEIIRNRGEKARNITIDVLEGSLAGKRMSLRDAPDEAITSAHKINDLFLESEHCRNLNLNKRLSLILSTLLKSDPLVINSLSFRKGSQQPYHFDTYYMPPPVDNMMVVSSICLENQSLDTGPISYYPGSHLIPPYKFSHGGIHATNEEMPQATAYIQEKIAAYNLQPETFLGEAGDVFIWHAQLYHGGTPIKNHIKTRKTLVTHYWRTSDVDKHRVATTNDGSGSYLLRQHQKVT